MKSAIVAIGTASPPYQCTQPDTAELILSAVDLSAVERRLLKSVYKATGIEKRHSVLEDYCRQPGEFSFFPNDKESNFPSTAERMRIYKENALNLALSAVANCLESNNTLDASHITHVITVSCTGMYAPGIDVELVQALNLHSHTKRTAIQFMGCYGAFNAIKVADSICRADSDATVLIVCVEICSIHFQKKMNLDNILANSIFADGAAAVIVQSENNQKKYLALDAFHCDLLPQANQAMTWDIADSGFDIVLSSYVPDMIESGIAEFSDRLLKQQGFDLSQIGLYAIHPGGVKILEACETALNITKKHNRFSYRVLNDFGNMSSATVLFVLRGIWDELNNKMHHQSVFSCAFGPGLTLESMLLRTHCV
jgi:predicted naringenin-chalcone synthase